MVPNVMLCPPNTLAAIVTPVAFATKGGQRVARRSSFATDQRRLVDGKGKSVQSKSHRLFRDVLQASVEIGSIFRHLFQFQAKFVPIIVRVLFPSSLGTQSSIPVSDASPSSFVRCRGRC